MHSVIQEGAGDHGDRNILEAEIAGTKLDSYVVNKLDRFCCRKALSNDGSVLGFT